LTSHPKISPALRKRAAQIKVLLMDVDGTMTDGGVSLLSQTEEIALEIKTFDAHDGQGLTLAHTAGLRTGCITGRQSSALLRRAHEMNMEFIYMKQPLKMPAYEEIVQKTGVSDSAVAYIGDDLPDIPVMRRAGSPSRWATRFRRLKRQHTTQRKRSQATARSARRLNSFSSPKEYGKR